LVGEARVDSVRRNSVSFCHTRSLPFSLVISHTQPCMSSSSLIPTPTHSYALPVAQKYVLSLSQAAAEAVGDECVGLLLMNNSTHYDIGVTPLVCALPLCDVREVLGVPVPVPELVMGVPGGVGVGSAGAGADAGVELSSSTDTSLSPAPHRPSSGDSTLSEDHGGWRDFNYAVGFFAKPRPKKAGKVLKSKSGTSRADADGDWRRGRDGGSAAMETA
jgi:hypothetical protein